MRFPTAKRLVVLCIAFYFIITCYLFAVHKPLRNTATKPSKLTVVSTRNLPSTLTEEKRKKDFSRKPSKDWDFRYNESRSVLVFTEYARSKFLNKLKVVLKSQRISFDIVTWNRFNDNQLSLPRLRTNHDSIKYSGFIFDNFQIYENLDIWTKSELHDFCKKYNLGIILLCAIDYKKESEYIKLKSLPLWIKFSMKGLYDTELNPNSPILRMTKAGQVLKFQHRFKHSVFWSNHSSFEPVSYSYRDSAPIEKNFVLDDVAETKKYIYRVNRSKFVTIMYDKGEFDGIKKVFFGGRIDGLWQYHLLLLDALTVFSKGKLGRPLTQWILVDIDDIFVARTGIALKKVDVEALVESQDRLSRKVKNFRFNLGFSGHYFKHGTSEENEGDEMLVKHADKFSWFPHMYKHRKPHLSKSLEELVSSMNENKLFAEKYGIPVNNSYSVAPHHSGVYPVHEELYEAWKKVWDIKVTTTEEYPHLYPSWERRGFIFRGINVLPRQTAGLFTANIYFRNYPKGRHRLEKSINGGELFMTFINNPISLFMTHFGNYGNDRLALYTFESVIEFIEQWTNLKMVTEKPVALAKKYFEFWPEDACPVWRNPCNDSRHLEIWSPNKSCQRLPKCLIVGPQKTGTTALRAFMRLHPNLITSKLSQRFYEEIQFFNNATNYAKGLDWYMSYFPDRNNSKRDLYFEKSANYFDATSGYYRASALLPDAKIIVLAADPALRAYSWYQHHLAKRKWVATENSFFDVISKKHENIKLQIFQRRTLHPGFYAEYLEKWLSVYPPEQILILDSEVITKDPATALTTVQKFLRIKPFDFKAHIIFDREKGFFCPLRNKVEKRCLGPGKGRNYPRMDLNSERYLREFYRLPNLRFALLLKRYKMPIPGWLKRQLRELE
ncbi:bifunctional heparan sulfate N-deacetylase/N-sulfotransferase 3-like isoform X2 [Rhopilema esculentum]|uniref:bifunctional heparan sulfate N-deacetylase/N-sulfotransferase 3-like isoform X2 n=1 Tax=Rhopilema esculentum TaxID=499914 RepID=UPI0031D7056C